MPLDRTDVCAALPKKGFREADNNKDHVFFYLDHLGKVSAIFTKVSRGSSHKVISDNLVSKMARQVRLSRSQFCKLVECSISKDDYFKLLIKDGHIAS